MEKIKGIVFTFFISSAKKDYDNHFIIAKWVMDGLVKAGIIPNDTQRYTPAYWVFYFIKTKTNPRIEVELI